MDFVAPGSVKMVRFVLCVWGGARQGRVRARIMALPWLKRRITRAVVWFCHGLPYFKSQDWWCSQAGLVYVPGSCFMVI